MVRRDETFKQLHMHMEDKDAVLINTGVHYALGDYHVIIRTILDITR